MLKRRGSKKRFIIRRLDKVTGVRHTIVIYNKGGILHTTEKESEKNAKV
jgi:hypothetical protein